ncbi:uncharacterized protein LOC143447307 isoform X3 [Clavelina lepadiformis]|uniref:uncharacterized protein LOC143447307 isoform X3 n=1 Tax=Clavelina lepadiformis TaxID=159417 RepID=UPI0040410CCA
MYENLDRKTKKSRCLKNTPRRNYDRCQHPSFDDHQSSITVFDTKKMWMKIYGIDVRRFRPVNNEIAFCREFWWLLPLGIWMRCVFLCCCGSSISLR